MKFTDYPVEVPMASYDAVIEKVLSALRDFPGLVAVYQIGGVTEPGISDVDLFAVFEHGRKCRREARHNLDKADRYMVMHSLFGASEQYWRELRTYTFFHNYQHLWGRELPVEPVSPGEEAIDALKRQIALEYLVKMYVNTVVENRYGICRVRSLLLHVKGLLYDLEFLGVNNGPLHELVTQVIAWRQCWFSDRIHETELLGWMQAFIVELEAFLREEFLRGPLYLPFSGPHALSRNLTLVPADEMAVEYKGISLPGVFGGLGRRYFNIQHRFNFFRFSVPAGRLDDSPVIAARFDFLQRMRAYNDRYIPHFSPAASSLQIV